MVLKLFLIFLSLHDKFVLMCVIREQAFLSKVQVNSLSCYGPILNLFQVLLLD